MNKSVVIVGASGHGKVVADIVLKNKDNIVGFLDDNTELAESFAGFPVLGTTDQYQKYSDPCFIKPKDGSSSINAFKVENESELEVYAGQIEDYIIQPFIEGTEYTVDIFCDYEGKAIFVIPRVRMAVRAGEVLKTKITMDERIIAECQKLLKSVKDLVDKMDKIRKNYVSKEYSNKSYNFVKDNFNSELLCKHIYQRKKELIENE